MDQSDVPKPTKYFIDTRQKLNTQMSEISTFSKGDESKKDKLSKFSPSGKSSPLNMSQHMFQTQKNGQFFMPKLALTSMGHYMATPTKYTSTRRSFFETKRDDMNFVFNDALKKLNQR